MEVVAPFLPPSPKDAVREKDSGRPTMPARNVQSNGVVQNDDVSASSYSTRVPVDIGAFPLFWLSLPPLPPLPFPSNLMISQNYPYAPRPYVPTLPPPSSLPPPSLPFWDNTCIYTQTLPCASSFAPPPVPLPELTHLRLMIAKQIDYYFSDDNLAKDLFLRTRMDDEGWVSITLIAGFRRVSALSKDSKFILDSMIYSDVVEVEGQKLRRHGTWKKWLLNFPKQISK